MAARPRSRRRRDSYTLRSECHDHTRACLFDDGSYFLPSRSPLPRSRPSLPGINGSGRYEPQKFGAADISVDSAYFTSPEGISPAAPPPPPSPTKTRSSTWLSSLRQLLHKSTPQKTAGGEPAAAVILPESLVGCTATVPESEEELDRFLFEVWTKDTVAHPRCTASPVSAYVRKVSELRSFYEEKMAEAAQREAAYLSELPMYYSDAASTPILHTEQLSWADSMQLHQVLIRAKVNYKFDEMRYKLKKEAADTVAKLRAQYITENGRRKKNLPQKATKLLNEWFKQHLDNPYPTDEEKKVLSSRGGITIEQVSTWFANKRSRSRAARGIPKSKPGKRAQRK